MAEKICNRALRSFADVEVPYAVVLVKTDHNGLVTDAVEDESRIITNYKLYQNFPDPFNPSTTIRFDLPGYTYVTLKIYDLLGREVETLIEGNLNAGPHNVLFNLSSLSTGVHFYRLSAVDFVGTKKMILMK